MPVRLFRALLLRPWLRIHDEARAAAARDPGLDKKPMIVLLLTALILWTQHYYGRQHTFESWFPSLQGGLYSDLEGWLFRLGTKITLYCVVPAIAIKLLGGRLRDHGLSLRGTRKHLLTYLVLLVVVLPLVVIASTRPSFQSTYPFYRDAARSWLDLLAWELPYAAAFFGIEFFFRGFLLFSLKDTMGPYAIFVMLAPYAMVHFQKPPLEALGAIVAGLVLGTLALGTGSIWGGVLVHLGVGWSMDLLAIAHTTGFPTVWRFDPGAP